MKANASQYFLLNMHYTKDSLVRRQKKLAKSDDACMKIIPTWTASMRRRLASARWVIFVVNTQIYGLTNITFIFVDVINTYSAETQKNEKKETQSFFLKAVI